MADAFQRAVAGYAAAREEKGAEWAEGGLSAAPAEPQETGQARPRRTSVMDRFRQLRRRRRRQSPAAAAAPAPAPTPPPAPAPAQPAEQAEMQPQDVSPRTLDAAVAHMIDVFDDERVIVADRFRQRIEAVLAAEPAAAHAAARARLRAPDVARRLGLMEERARLALAALDEFNLDDGWTFAQRMFGVTTMYKAGEGGTIWVRLEGNVEGVSLLETSAVLRETDLFDRWAPFCDRAELLKMISRVELVTYFNISLPLFKRDAVVHVYGVDATEEGCMVLLGQSVDAWEGVAMPPVRGWNADRMVISGFKALIEPLSPTEARTCIVVNIDPKAPLPQSLINFVMKKIAGVLLMLVQKEAKKVAASPDNVHARRVAADAEFYDGWLRRKLSVFLSRRSGSGAGGGGVAAAAAPVAPVAPVKRSPEPEPPRTWSQRLLDPVLDSGAYLPLSMTPGAALWLSSAATLEFWAEMAVLGAVKLAVVSLMWWMGMQALILRRNRRNRKANFAGTRWIGLGVVAVVDALLSGAIAVWSAVSAAMVAPSGSADEWDAAATDSAYFWAGLSTLALAGGFVGLHALQALQRTS